MMPGTFAMLLWPAGSWAVGVPWPPQGVPSLERGLDPSSWMISDVEEMRQPCDFVLRGPGVSTTVTIGRMLGPCVMVSGEGQDSVCVVTGMMGKKFCPSSAFTSCVISLFPILYSYVKPYAKLTRGDFVSLRGTGYYLVFGGHNEGVSPTFLLLVEANLALLGTSSLFFLTSKLPPFPALSTLFFLPTSCCSSGLWKPWACVGGSPGGGANVVVFPGPGMPLGDVQPTVPTVDSNSTTPRLLPTSVGQMPGSAGTWPPPASPTAPPEPGPKAGESLSALALRLSPRNLLTKRKVEKRSPSPCSDQYLINALLIT